MEELLKKQRILRFSGAGTSHHNGETDCAINTVFTIERTMLMNAALTYPDEKLFTNICTMSMNYDVCIYNRNPDIQSVLSAIEKRPSSIFQCNQ